MTHPARKPVDLELIALPDGPAPGADRKARWQEHAPCRGHSDLFFPAFNEQPSARQRREAEALTYCARCPYTEQCEQIAATLPDPWGIWAGSMRYDIAARGSQRSHRKRDKDKHNQWCRDKRARIKAELDALRAQRNRAS